MASPDMRRGPLALIAVLALGAVGAALWTQHRWDMQPCPWCVLQRLLFVMVALGAGLGLVWRGRAGTWVSLAVVHAGCGLGIAAALWQHFVASASASCNLTLADRIMGATQLDALLPEVFAATASCAEAKTHLLGAPYEFWSLALFVVLDGIALTGALRRRG